MQGADADNPSELRGGGQTFDAFVYSLDTFLPIVNLHQEEHWLPDATSSWGKALRAYLWFHILMGWALTTLGIAGATSRLVRRE